MAPPQGAAGRTGLLAPAAAARVQVIRSALTGRAGAQGHRVAGTTRATWQEEPNVDPDARDPSLLRAQLALLRTRPLLQRLPYSDGQVGVSLLGMGPGGRPLLAVTYGGSQQSAQADVRRVLARLNDRAQHYAFRYRRVR